MSASEKSLDGNAGTALKRQHQSPYRGHCRCRCPKATPSLSPLQGNPALLERRGWRNEIDGWNNIGLRLAVPSPQLAAITIQDHRGSTSSHPIHKVPPPQGPLDEICQFRMPKFGFPERRTESGYWGSKRIAS